jgi:hypothetical protein
MKLDSSLPCSQQLVIDPNLSQLNPVYTLAYYYYSCWLFNCPLAVELGTQINKELNWVINIVILIFILGPYFHLPLCLAINVFPTGYATTFVYGFFIYWRVERVWNVFFCIIFRAVLEGLRQGRCLWAMDKEGDAECLMNRHWFSC